MAAAVDVEVLAEVRPPRCIVQPIRALDADPVFREHQIVLALHPLIGFLVVGVIQTCDCLEAVEVAGDDVRAGHDLAALVDREALVVDVDLDIHIGQRRIRLAVFIQQHLRAEVFGFKLLQRLLQLLRKRVGVELIVHLQKIHRLRSVDVGV